MKVIKYIRCGKKNCSCYQNHKKSHGPYIYDKYKDHEGKIRYKYLGKVTPELIQEIRREIAWKKMKKTGNI